MINYQYSHTGSEYSTDINEKTNDKLAATYQALFEEIRTTIDGNEAFAYLPLISPSSDKWFMYEASIQDKKFFAEGYSGEKDDIAKKTIEYYHNLINTTRKASSSEPDSTRLPRIFGSSKNSNSPYYDVCVKIVDALIYGDQQKRVVVSIENDKIKDIIDCISEFLPLEYLINLGVVLGCKKLPDFTYSKIANDGKTYSWNIRMIVSDYSERDYNALAAKAYVFDTINGRSNYTAELSTWAHALSKRKVSGEDTLRNAINQDGQVDLGRLDNSVVRSLFEVEPTKETAKDVLSLYQPTGTDEENILFCNAIRLLLEETVLTADDYRLIDTIRDRNSTIKTDTDIDYCLHLVGNYYNLNSQQISKMTNLLIECKNDSLFEAFIERDIADERFSLEKLFNDTCALFSRIKIGDYDAWVEKAIAKFDFNEWRNIDLSADGQQFGEKLFLHLLEYDEGTANYFAAILMASAYQKSSARSDVEVRGLGLRKYIDRRYSSVDEKIDCLINIRINILDFAKRSMVKDVVSAYFLTDEIIDNPSRRWVENLIYKLTFESKIGFFIKSTRMRGEAYIGLHTILQQDLLNIDLVKKYVTNGTDLEEKYRTFFDGFDQAQKNEHMEIYLYLTQIDNEVKISSALNDFRCQFVSQCYNTLSDVSKKKVSRIDDASSIYDSNDKSAFAETISNEFSPQIVTQHRRKSIFPISFWVFTVLLAIASASILVVPAVIQCSVLELTGLVNIIARMGIYLHPACFAIPVAAIAVNIIAFLKMKRNNLLRANLLTLISVIIPECMFVLSYIAFYFISLMLF